MAETDIWAVVPIKETAEAKQRLAQSVPADLRPAFTLAMFEDVLDALASATGLAGIIALTADEAAAGIARRFGARVVGDEARGGHSAVIAAAARRLVREGCGGMLQVPGDIPLATGEEISMVLRAHPPAPSFTIVPAHDEMGSNAIVVSPPDAVPLTFGENSFFPHLDAARARGIEPQVVRAPGIGRDIDGTEDIRAFARLRSKTCAQAFLDDNGFEDWGAQ